MKTIVRVIVLFCFLVIALAGFIFIRYNQVETGLWLGIEFAARPVGQWLLLFFIAGSVVGLLAGLGIYRHLKNRVRLRMLENRVAKLTEENRQLRTRLQSEQSDSAT